MAYISAFGPCLCAMFNYTQAAVSADEEGLLETSKSLLHTLLAGAADVQAVMPVRLFPLPLAARAVSALITQVHSKRPLQLLPQLWVSQPQQHDQSGRSTEHHPLPMYV